MASYLTRQDVDNFGSELIDVAQRAGLHAVAPHLQRLQEENEELRDEISRAAKLSIDQYLDAHVPNWREINADARFHNWLLQPDPYSGIIRDRLLKDAAHAANAATVARFFTGFLAAAGQAPAGSAPQGSSQAPSGKPIYTRPQITEMAARRRKGLIDDQAWARWEHEMVAAGREGRIVGALGIDGLPTSRLSR